MLDGKPSDFSETDQARRNAIANLLAEWKLCDLVDPKKTEEPVVQINTLKILPYKEKSEWKLETKYNVGNSVK